MQSENVKACFLEHLTILKQSHSFLCLSGDLLTARSAEQCLGSFQPLAIDLDVDFLVVETQQSCN